MTQKIQRPTDRPPRRRVPIGTPEQHVDELSALGELMLGAAWADGDKHPVEIVAIAEMLKEFVGAPRLPDHVISRLDCFEPDRFDVTAATRRLHAESDEDRLAILQLLARVTGADKVLTQTELAYLKRVAESLGLDPELLHVSVSFL
jgi:uncharacterized tellurite resistance protein B-like protein